MAKKNFGIPDNLLAEITARDKFCAYCHKTIYCIDRNINADTVAKPVKRYLQLDTCPN